MSGKRYKVFVDGSEGTTGLRIGQRLATRPDVELLTIDPALRKNPEERARLLNEADLAFLCLPDAAARESAALLHNQDAILIDASTAHRTAPGWAYGLPELGADFRTALTTAKRIAVPGCHATGFNLLVHPLLQAGLLPPDYPVVCHSVTGYSGGGKGMIADYEAKGRSRLLDSPRQYALGLSHKHLPEMQRYGRLRFPPLFNPIVGDFYAGMAVSVPLHTPLLRGSPTASELHAILTEHYAGQQLVQVAPFGGGAFTEGGFLAANQLAGYDSLVIIVTGNDTQAQLVALFDNLGKGASGAAVQCMNIVLGLRETTGLTPFDRF